MRRILLALMLLCIAVPGYSARFLVMAQSVTNIDPVKDERGCYKRGDIVDVRPDSHVWGNAEAWPKFLRLDIPGLDPVNARKYMDSHTDNTDPANLITLKRRLWSVMVDNTSIPLSIRNQIKTGQVTVTLAQIRNFIRNKATLQTADFREHFDQEIMFAMNVSMVPVW